MREPGRSGAARIGFALRLILAQGLVLVGLFQNVHCPAGKVAQYYREDERNK